MDRAFYMVWDGWSWTFPGITLGSFWFEYHKLIVDESILGQLEDRI
jgi:hypothetical protein